MGVGPSEHHPVSGGRLCARGWAAHEATLWGPRIVHPLVRKDGRLEACGWDQAISAAADALSRLVSAGRPVGVLGSGRASNEECFLTAALARAALRTGNVDAPLRAPYEHLLRGVGAGAGIPALSSTLSEIAVSDLILVLEGDLAATHPRAAFEVLQARRRGARLVTLGWSTTRLSRLAAAHVLLPPGDPLRPLRELVEAVRSGAAPPSESSQAVADVSSWLTAARRPALVLGTPQSDGALLEAAASLLAKVLREAEARSGEGERAATVVPLPVKANSRGAREMGLTPHLLPGCLPLDDAAARERLRKVWGAEPSAMHGLSAAEMPGGVDGLVVVAEDPVASAPSPAEASRALETLDALVVLDSHLTTTAQAADVVLPLAAFGEAWGTFTNLEGRVQRCRPIVHPPGEAREGWMALGSLLHALGVRTPFGTWADVFAALAKGVPAYSTLDILALEAGPSEPAPATGLAVGALEISDRVGALPGQDGRWVVRVEGTFEWGDDPMVASSPTLRRDPSSFRKLHPGGVVWISPEDAKAAGIREGWKVRLRSGSGEVEVAVSLRPGLGRKLLLVPFTFRDELGTVLGGAPAAEVEVSRS